MNQYPQYTTFDQAESRAQFIVKTYIHLFFAILAFVLIEMYLFQSGKAQVIAQTLLGVNWLFVLGAFMVGGWIATHTAEISESKPAQYLALIFYVVLESIIFVPILWIAEIFCPGVIGQAAQVTLAGFAGLTLIAFYTQKDFSFLRVFLMWGFFCAIGLIAASVLFGWNLGTWFTVAMIAFSGAAILFDTSNVIHHYDETRYISAALHLFASVALLFWYVLRLMMALNRN